MGQKPTPKWVLSKIITVSVFWTITLLVLLYASGVRVNWQSGRISSSVSISLKTQDKLKDKINYTLNGVEQQGELPLVLSQLQPGHYTINVQREGAMPWQRSVYLEPGSAALYHNIVFVPQSIAQRDPTTSERRQVLAKQQLIDDGLVIRDTELYRTDKDQEELIVRMSENIDQAFWYTRKTHVLVKTGTTVSLLEVDGGTNRTKLFTLASDSPIKVLVADEKTIIVAVGQTVTVYDLTLPSTINEPSVETQP